MDSGGFRRRTVDLDELSPSGLLGSTRALILDRRSQSQGHSSRLDRNHTYTLQCIWDTNGR